MGDATSSVRSLRVMLDKIENLSERRAMFHEIMAPFECGWGIMDKLGLTVDPFANLFAFATIYEVNRFDQTRVNGRLGPFTRRPIF